MKQINEMNYLLAIQAADQSNYLPISDSPYEGEEQRIKMAVVPTQVVGPRRRA